MTYSARYTTTLVNTGGETLTAFSFTDDTLPAGAEELECRVDGAVVSDFTFDGTVLTLPAGLARGQTLTLTYADHAAGTLDGGGLLTLRAPVSVEALGVESGLWATGSGELSMPLVICDLVMLSPADIVIYAGGADTGSDVVEGEEGTVAQSTNLPEPGFFLSLPPAVAEQLRAAIGFSGGPDQDVDLSEYLAFEDSAGGVWGVEPFQAENSMARGRMLYRLKPITPGQEPLRMQFYDGERYIVESEFDITTALHQEYEMSIYPGYVEAGSVEAVLTVNGTELGRYDLGFSPGKLIIRGTTGALTTTGIVDAQSAPEETVEEITACAAPGTEYYINQSTLTVDAQDVALLVDGIVDSAHGQTLRDLAEAVLKDLPNQNRLNYQFRYLDLVDTSMGNAWVTASQPVEVLWPYPEGTGAEDGFTLIHYRSMDRDYELEDMPELVLGSDYTLEVYTTGALGADTAQVTYHTLTAGERGLSFVADGFSPYLLVWEGAEAPGTAVSGGSGSDGPANLNTGDHMAYLVGRGEGGIQPLAPVTRGEVASILFRLLTDEAREIYWNTGSPYEDVAEGAWYHNAVATLTAMGILYGRAEGRFDPDAPITRAELTAMAVRFFDVEEAGELPFTDVEEDAWYAPALRAGVALGLVSGRGNGTFDPDAPITRAETAAILNRVLGRRPESGALLEGEEPWNDNPSDAWYYADMLEASRSHRFTWQGTGEERTERWTALLEERDWAALEQTGPARP